MMENFKIRLFLLLCGAAMAILPSIPINVPALSTMDLSRISLRPSEMNNIEEIRVSTSKTYDYAVMARLIHYCSLVSGMQKSYADLIPLLK